MYQSITITTVTNDSVIMDSSLPSLLRFAAINGLNRQEMYRTIGFEGGITQHDTSKVSGYELSTVNGDFAGYILKDRDNWYMVLSQKAITADTADMLKAIRGN